MFDGIACGRVALERTGIKVDTYYASEIDKYAIQVAKKNYPDIVHLGNVNEIDFSEMKGKIDLVIGGSPCFVAGTKVITNEGYKNIEDIQKGDLVLTHKNRFMQVTDIGYEYKPTVNLKAQGILNTTTTLNHPYYVRTMQRVWNNNRRRSERVFSEPYWKDVKDLNKNDYIGMPIITIEENPLNLTKEDCWLLGRYVADGHLRKTKRKNRINSYQYQVVFSIGSHKVEYFKEKITQRHFSCYPHTKSVHRCIFSSMELLEFIKKHKFGERALNKNIPHEIMKLPIPLASEFLQGYFSGDGSQSRDVISATTISMELAMNLSLLIAKCYKVNSSIMVNKVKPTTIIEGRVVNQNTSYTVQCRTQMKKQTRSVIIDNIVWSPFTSFDINTIEQKVYNLTVEEDNSYTANNAIVHNCTHWSIARRNRETTSSGIGYELFMRFATAVKQTECKYFLYENNDSIHKDIKDAISKELGVNYIMINSSLLSAQNRKRCYWTNIPGVEQPQDKGILLKDIVLDDVEPVVLHNLYGGFNEDSVRVFENKSPTLRTSAGGGHIPSFVKKNLLHTPEAIEYMNRQVSDGRTHWDFAHHSDIRNNKSATVVANFFKGVPYNVFKDWNCIRKFHPIECERLQTLPTWSISLEVNLCLDQARSYVNVVNKNPKLQKLVLNVEKIKSNELVELVEKNMNANNLLIKYIALNNVDTGTQKATRKCTNLKPTESHIHVSNVENHVKCQNRKKNQDSVLYDVFTNTIQEVTLLSGKEELLLNDNKYIYPMNGKMPLKLSGKEIMQLVEGVEKDLITEMENRFTSIILNRLGIKNIEQMLIICYWYSKAVIDGYIVEKTQENNLLLNYLIPYTEDVSSTQRYKMIGNGWTVDIVAHILRYVKDELNQKG